jgi:hypothetical protein
MMQKQIYCLSGLLGSRSIPHVVISLPRYISVLTYSVVSEGLIGELYSDVRISKEW